MFTAATGAVNRAGMATVPVVTLRDISGNTVEDSSATMTVSESANGVELSQTTLTDIALDTSDAVFELFAEADNGRQFGGTTNKGEFNWLAYWNRDLSSNEIRHIGNDGLIGLGVWLGVCAELRRGQ
jgi:hypothetical protein